MQDDRTLTFQDIHGSNEALLAAVRGIERIALVESYEISPLRLRFLEPFPQGGSSHDFVLTSARDYRVIDLTAHEYLTVSYVWSHTQPIDGIELPNYRIWDGDNLGKPPRPLRCPPIVFHRVVEFATARNLARVWIDQECINQDDPSDIEQHLQDMHRIYRFSRITVAVLSIVIKDWSWVESCFGRVGGGGRAADEIVLRQMIHDPWFTRSWTFHEQHCAGNLIYLLPRPPFQTITPTIDGFITTPPSHLEKDVSVDQTALMSFFNSFQVMHKSDLVLKSFFLGHGYACWISENIPGAIESMQEKMEKRENSVLSDRIQIMANVCGLGWKLKTTLLNTPMQSYSTCLLALTMANTWPDPVERARQYQARGDAFMSAKVGVALVELKMEQRTDLRRLPGFRRNFIQPYEG